MPDPAQPTPDEGRDDSLPDDPALRVLIEEGRRSGGVRDPRWP